MNLYYKSMKLSDQIIRITSATEEMFYLVIGTKKAALIDAGTGYGDLDLYIKTLTKLPIINLATHGHCDHASGHFYYDEMYIHPIDIDLVTKHCTYEIRSEYVKLLNPSLYKTMKKKDFVPLKKIRYIPICEGDLIDLGGIVLEVIEAQGHTNGSLCFLDREHKVLFSGDACNQRTFLFADHSASVVAYTNTLIKLIALQPNIEHIYNCHDSGELPKECFGNVLQCCIDILKHKDDHVPFEFLGMKGFIAKEIGNEVERADGVYGNIVYNENKLY